MFGWSELVVILLIVLIIFGAGKLPEVGSSLGKGIKNFRKGKIWWHKQWWGPVPSLYWPLLIIVIVLIYFGRTAV
jgi:TatA/E family protein of Tat protein translocase